MIPRPAQYILRCDDLCPTVSQPGWQRYLDLIGEFRLQPILAVVPDNRDPDLALSPPNPEFWSSMRTLQAAGATIALHGFRHLSGSRGRSLMPLHRSTEFAGVPVEVQRQWIHAGMEILRGHGLNPRIWVAPRHGFDLQTLHALQQEGIHALSDGLARIPFTRDGITWIPQQLWEPVEKTHGLWTICVHPNTAQDSSVHRLHAFLQNHAAQFTSAERVLAEAWPPTAGLTERLYAARALVRIRASRFKRRFSIHSPARRAD
jgi:predicted deacetylase